MFITSSLPFPPPPSFPHPPSLSPPDALALNKEMEFSAIQGILRHLDDNADGSVDLQESEEVHTLFARAEGRRRRRGRGREGGWYGETVCILPTVRQLCLSLLLLHTTHLCLLACSVPMLCILQSVYLAVCVAFSPCMCVYCLPDSCSPAVPVHVLELGAGVVIALGILGEFLVCIPRSAVATSSSTCHNTGHCPPALHLWQVLPSSSSHWWVMPSLGSGPPG